MAADRPIAPWRRPGAGRDLHTRAVRRLTAACAAGDIEGLLAVLDPAVVLISDGDEPDRSDVGVTAAGPRMIQLLNPPPGIDVSERSVNGRTGLLLTHATVVTTVISFAVRGRRITQIWIVLRPEHLRDFNRQLP